MGCDIHCIVEVRGPGGLWHVHDNRGPKPPDGDDDAADATQAQSTYDFWRKWWDACPDYIWSGRDYDLFGILADVRNGRGFAGVKTGESFIPIASPRGVPDDASEEARKFLDEMGSDGHSHSYHTVADLLAYNWHQTRKQKGFVNAYGYMTWKRDGYPAFDGLSWRHTAKQVISKKQMAALVTKLGAGVESAVLLGCAEVAEIKWLEPYREAVHGFYDKTIPAMQKLGAPEDVRMLFYFDN